MIFHSPAQEFVILTLSILTVISHFGLSLADPLITVCDSSQYKRVVEDTCSSVYKRMKHPHHHFESMRHHDDHIEKHRHRHYHFKHKHHKHIGHYTPTESSVVHTPSPSYDFRIPKFWSLRRLRPKLSHRLRPLRESGPTSVKTKRKSSSLITDYFY